MSPLNTAYALGEKQAAADFEQQLKQAFTPGGSVPPAPTRQSAINPQVAGGVHNMPVQPPPMTAQENAGQQFQGNAAPPAAPKPILTRK